MNTIRNGRRFERPHYGVDDLDGVAIYQALHDNNKNDARIHLFYNTYIFY